MSFKYFQGHIERVYTLYNLISSLTDKKLNYNALRLSSTLKIKIKK
jgi:hypothetical protein